MTKSKHKPNSSISILQTHFDYLTQGEIDKISEIWHPDASIEFPFSTPPIDPTLVPPKITGKQDIMAFWQGASQGLKPGGKMQYQFIAQLEDPAWCLARAKGLFQTLDNRDYHNDYCLLAKITEGQIVEYIEYSNPLISLDVFDLTLSK